MIKYELNLELLYLFQFIISKFPMSEGIEPIKNDLRYEIAIKNHTKRDSTVLYEVLIFDLIFRQESKLIIRFKELKKFHEKLELLALNCSLPDFPKTNSFVFWNKTNDSEKKISERKR